MARRYRDRVKRLRSFATYGLDALIALLALAAAAGTLARSDSHRPDGLRLGLEVVAVVAMILTLLLRRRAPLLVPATTWLVSAALSFLDGRLIVGQAAISIAGMIAAILLGNLRSKRQARIGLAVVVTCAAVVVYHDPTHTLSNLLLIPVLFAVGWLVGFALHERAEQMEAAEQRAASAERERESAARVAVAEERARIARELHDIVAHAMSVMVLQVGAVRHRLPAHRREDREALQSVEQAGRTVLAEMRRLLDAMRRDEDEMELAPQPGMQNLTRLLDDVRAAGLDVQFDVHGEPVPLSPGLDLSAYRILQEGLTNTLKHAHAQHADVHVRYGKDRLELEVRDDGRGPMGQVDHEQRHGHGLVGIGERVKIYGGDLTTGASATGGFALRARLPLDAAVTR
jgi:signal transduction histidine kinase